MTNLKKIGCLIVLLCVSVLLNAQVESMRLDWAIGMGSEWGEVPYFTPPPLPPFPLEGGKSVAVDKLGNVYVTGVFTDTVDFDPTGDSANLVAENVSNLDFGQSNIFIAKYTSSGQLIWAKQIGGYVNSFNYPESVSILLDVSDHFFLTGNFSGSIDFDPSTDSAYSVPGFQALFIAKYDTDGNFQWVKEINGDYHIKLENSVLDQQGNLILKGRMRGTYDFDPSADTLAISLTAYSQFIAKYSGNGDLVWVKPFIQIGNISSNYTNDASGISVDTSGNVFITGVFSGTVDFNPSDTQENTLSTVTASAFIAKLDTDGTYNWAFKLGSRGAAIVADKNGMITIAGSFAGTVDFDPSSGSDEYSSDFGGLYLVRYDGNGNLLWVKQLGGVEFTTYDHRLILTPDDQLIVTGKFTGHGDFDPSNTIRRLVGEPGFDLFMAKYTNAGDYKWAKQIGSPDGVESIKSLVADTAEAVYITGSFTEKVDFDPGSGVQNLSSKGGSDIFLGKYSECIGTIAPTEIDFEACNGYTAPSGTLLNRSGTYLDVVTGSSGCDSVITINLMLNHTFGSITAEDCSTYTAPDGLVYTTSGIRTAVLTNSIGCDSIITIYLKIKNTSSTIVREACSSYTAPDGAVYTTSGYKTAVIPNAAGCDSTIGIWLTIQINSTVTVDQNVLTVTEYNAVYQWLDCNNGYAPLEGETNRSFTTFASGSFAVSVTQSGCTDTSACFPITFTGIGNYNAENRGRIFPNPAGSELFIDFGGELEKMNVKLVDLPGKLIFSKHVTNTSKLRLDLSVAPGIYFIILDDGTERQTFKVVKE